MQVIADFDRTLTKCFISPGACALARVPLPAPPSTADWTRATCAGVRGVSAHGALERSPHLPVEYHNKARALFEK